MTTLSHMTNILCLVQLYDQMFHSFKDVIYVKFRLPAWTPLAGVRECPVLSKHASEQQKKPEE